MANSENALKLQIVIGDFSKIAIFKGGNQSTPLSVLKKFLLARNDIKPSDKFLMGHSVVGKDDEASLTIADIMEKKDDGDEKSDARPKLCTINFFRKTTTHQTPDIPELPDVPTGDPLEKKHVDETDHTSGIMPTGTASSEVRDYYMGLGPKKRGTLFEDVGLFRGFSPDLEDFIAQSDTDGFHLKIEQTEPHFTSFQETYIEDHFVTDTFLEQEIDKAVSHSASVSASGWGVSGSAKYTSSHKSHSDHKERHFYLCSQYLVRKVRLSFHVDDLVLAPELETKLTEIADGGRDVKNYRIFIETLKTWGAYFPTAMVIGGKLILEDKRVFTTDVEQTSATTTFQAAASASFGNFSGSASYAGSDKNDVSNVSVSQTRKVKLRAFGGEEARVHNPPEYLASLGPYTEWRNCKIEALIPIYKLASEDVQLKIRDMLVEHRALWEREMAIDFDKYIRGMEDLAASEFG